MKRCIYCGQELGDSVKFCHACGAQQENRIPAQNAPVFNEPQQPYAAPQQPYVAPQQAPYPQQQYQQPYPPAQPYEAQQPYGQEPYYDPAPPYYPPVAPTNGKATASLVLGILSIVGIVLPIIPLSNFVMPLLAVIFGIIGRKECEVGHPKRGSATAGLVLGIIKLLLVLLFIVLLITAFGTITALLSDYPFMEEIFDAIEEVFDDLF